MMAAMAPTAPMTGRRMLLVRAALASAASLALAVAFPPWDVLGGWLAVPAFAALVACFRGLPSRRARGWFSGGGAMVGLAAGLSFFLVLLEWGRAVGPDAWVALTLLGAPFWAVGGAVLPALLARRWWVLTVPLLWVSMEAMRATVPVVDFTWGRLAFSQAATSLVGWAAVGGPALASFVVALAGTLLLKAWLAAALQRWRVTAASLAGLLVVAAAGGLLLRVEWAGLPVGVEPIAVVQGNVPRVGLDFNEQRRAVLDNHVAETAELAAAVDRAELQQPVAVIWPENSSDINPYTNADAAEQIDSAARQIDAPLLVGAVVTNPQDPPRDQHPGTVLNLGVVWDPVTGPGDTYAKRHPVPFGEYIPLRGLLERYITRFDRIPRDFAPGQEVGVLELGPVTAAVVICFEISDDPLIRDAVRSGGQVLVVQTNNATYGLTSQPEQQLAITRVQAVASGRSTLVAATSGVSAVIDPRGALEWHTEEFTADSTVVDVPLRTGLTPAMRLGVLPEVLAVGLLLVLAARAGRPDAGVRSLR